jgi:hypothetical protein
LPDPEAQTQTQTQTQTESHAPPKDVKKVKRTSLLRHEDDEIDTMDFSIAQHEPPKPGSVRRSARASADLRGRYVRGNEREREMEGCLWEGEPVRQYV